LFYLPKCVSFFAKISLRKGRRGAFFVIIFVQTLMLRNASIVRRKKKKEKRRRKKTSAPERRGQIFMSRHLFQTGA
jgi:hypothetical protein